MTKLDVNKRTTFRFKIAVSGSKNIPTARLMIQGKGMLYGVPATIQGDQISAVVTKAIAAQLAFKKGKVWLEVIVGESMFKPWSDDVTVIQDLKVSVTALGEEVTEEPTKIKQQSSGDTVSIISEEEDDDPAVELQPVDPEPSPDLVIEDPEDPPAPIEEADDVDPQPDPKSVPEPVEEHKYSDECKCGECLLERKKLRDENPRSKRLLGFLDD